MKMLFTGLKAVPAVVLFVCAPVFCSSGGEYTVESSVVANGGGSKISGGDYAARGAISQTSMADNVGLTAGGDYVDREGFYNPPHFTFQKGLASALAMPSGDISLSIPANSVDLDRFDITMNQDPLNQPSAIDPAKIDEATSKIIRNDGAWSQLLPKSLAEMSIFNEQALYQKPLANKGVLTMRYRDDNNDGIVDGSNPPVRVDTLNTWTLDQEYNMWVRMPDAGDNSTGKSLSVYFGVPGVYAVLGDVDNAVRNVFAFPVPFRPNGPQAGNGPGQTGTEAAGITFTNVPQIGNIEIYTLDGRLVRKIAIPDNLILQDVKWDVKTASGEKAASGVYIWRVVSDSKVKTGKLMVIW